MNDAPEVYIDRDFLRDCLTGAADPDDLITLLKQHRVLDCWEFLVVITGQPEEES